MHLLVPGHLPHGQVVYAVSEGVFAALLAVGGYLLRRRRPDADEMESRRRLFLFENGRIIDGTVVDIHDEAGQADPGSQEAAPRRLVCYRYRVAGVHYESSQDVTALAEQMKNATSTVGFPVSVRYDPANPLNSIVVCEQWLGLHHNPIQPRRPSAGVPVRHKPERLRASS